MDLRKVSMWSAIILLGLILYLVFTLLFTAIFREVNNRRIAASPPAPTPTFTSIPIATPIVVFTATPPPESPSPTASPTPEPTPTEAPTETPTSLPTDTPTVVLPRLIASRTVNVRAGPGTNYPVIDTLPSNVPLVIIGQNEQGTWWQAQSPDGRIGWVADSVVDADRNVDVPIVRPSPLPPPSPTAVPPQAPTLTPVPQASHQYEPTGWYADTNYGLTRFLGTITDANGNPVNGVFVEAQCGDFRIISNPSGPVGWGPFGESHDWPPGFYDITLDTKPIACHWFLSVVETPDKETVTARLSEVIEVETTIHESIITANWRKNW